MENDLLEQLAEIAHRLSQADGADDLLQLIVPNLAITPDLSWVRRTRNSALQAGRRQLGCAHLITLAAELCWN